jgi:hypothetical protein
LKINKTSLRKTQIEFFIVNNEIIGEDKGYTDKPKAKVLIFGNEDEVQMTFLNQSYS